MQTFTKIKIALTAITGMAVLGFLNFHLPSVVVLQITGTDVIRVDAGNVANGSEPVGATRDVYEVYADSLDGKKSYVFVNEDVLYYFKFDSANVQSRATSIALNKGVAVITYTGWRIPILSMIPNALDIRTADRNERPWPIFAIVVHILLAAAGVAIWWFLRARRRLRAIRIASREAARVAEEQALLERQKTNEKGSVQGFIDGHPK